LESLVNLYGAEVPTDAGKIVQRSIINKDSRVMAVRTASIVQLARRRIGNLRSDLVRQRGRDLAAVSERLDAAEKLSKTDAGRAAAMYQAIIDLYRDDAWANEVVAKARSRLAELKK